MPTSLVRWMSITSGRSFFRDAETAGVGCVRLAVFWRILARGCVEISSESRDISSPETLISELSELFEMLRLFLGACFFAAKGFAHSGTGYNRSNCRRSRFVYSLPLTRSSVSAMRSLRSRGLEARETIMRSSSLSIQAGGSLWSD